MSYTPMLILAGAILIALWALAVVPGIVSRALMRRERRRRQRHKHQ